MDFETLREHTCSSLALTCPELADGAARLVDECFKSARQSLRTEFICTISPQAWAKITVIYFKHFVELGCDMTIGEIFAAVIRDSLNINRMDMLTLDLAQKKLDMAANARKSTLTVVKDEGNL
jgi:hypothetical protein